MEALTVRTEDGRRHFGDEEKLGASDLEKPGPPGVDGGACPLLWHTALQVAEYERLVAERDAARAAGRLVGIGLACYVELTGYAKSMQGIF